MNLLDLPLPRAFGDSPSAYDSAIPSEWLTAQEWTYSILPEGIDPLHCALVTNKRAGRVHLPVRASIARSRYKLRAAARLVQQRYAWRGYFVTANDVSPARDKGSAVTLIAETGGAAVGTMTLGLDGPGGLLAEECYPEKVSAVRSEGRRVCELGRLALTERADTRMVLAALFGLAYNVAKALQDVTDVFIEVNPRHVVFYRRVFGFVVDAGERLCERVQAPAVLLRASVDDVEARLQTYCSPMPNQPASSVSLQTGFA
jgi:hypothetical protein